MAQLQTHQGGGVAPPEPVKRDWSTERATSSEREHHHRSGSFDRRSVQYVKGEGAIETEWRRRFPT